MHQETEESSVAHPPPTSTGIPSFRQLLFPLEPLTAATAQISPRGLQRKPGSAHASTAAHSNPPASGAGTGTTNNNIPQKTTRVKTRYDIWREKRHHSTFKPSLSTDSRSDKARMHKGSLRFAIGESNLESNLTIGALNGIGSDSGGPSQIFEEVGADEDGYEKNECFDLSTFLEGLKRPKSAVKNLKANYIEELKERVEMDGSVQEGLSKEECLYYIEAFVSIDSDGSGAISEQELFEAMDTLDMDVTLESCRKMIVTVDANGDGGVSVDEFLRLMAGLRSNVTFLQSQDQLEFAFSLVDRDGDGLIGIQDLLTLYEDIGDQVRGEEVDFGTCKKMLQAVLGETYTTPKSDDPKINFAHFTKLVKAIGQ